MLKKLIVATVLATAFAVAPRTAVAEESSYWTVMLGIPWLWCEDRSLPLCNREIL